VLISVPGPLPIRGCSVRGRPEAPNAVCVPGLLLVATASSTPRPGPRSFQVAAIRHARQIYRRRELNRVEALPQVAVRAFPANGGSAPSLNTAHLGVQLPLEQVLQIDDLSQMRPGQLSTPCVDNLLIRKPVRSPMDRYKISIRSVMGDCDLTALCRFSKL